MICFHAQVSESLKMLALGDRAWNSSLGSRSKKVRKPAARSSSPAKDKTAAKDTTAATAAQVESIVSTEITK